MASLSWSVTSSCLRVACKPSTVWPGSVWSTAPANAPGVQASVVSSVFLTSLCTFPSLYLVHSASSFWNVHVGHPRLGHLTRVQAAVDLPPPESTGSVQRVPNKVASSSPLPSLLLLSSFSLGVTSHPNAFFLLKQFVFS